MSRHPVHIERHQAPASSNTPSVTERSCETEVDRKVQRERGIVEKIRNSIPAEMRLDLPVLSIEALLEQAKSYPLAAAGNCQHGIYLLETGRQRQLRNYIGVAYAVASSLRVSERHLEWFATDVRDGRSSSPLSLEKVKQNLLQHVFRYIFSDSGATTRNRAYQYAYGLQKFYDDNAPIDEVRNQVVRYGPEKLYRLAVERARLLEAAEILKRSGRHPDQITDNEILAQIATKDAVQEDADPGCQELPLNNDAWGDQLVASGEGTARKYEESCDAGGLLCDEDLVEKSPDTDIDETGSLEDDDLDCPEGDLDLARAENQLAVLSKLVIDLEVGLNKLRAIIESLRVGRNG